MIFIVRGFGSHFDERTNFLAHPAPSPLPTAPCPCYMFPTFLPSAVQQLTEATSIALAQSIKSQAITTSLTNQSIATTYVNQGSGTIPILLIHGFDSSVLEFRRLLPLLTGTHEIWAVDLLGFGFTERLSALAYSPTAIRTHLYQFWQTLIKQPVILVGASMGGATAIDFTLTYPEVVQKLVLIDSAGLKGGSPLSKFMFPPLDYLATSILRNPGIRTRISRAAYYNPTLISADSLCCGALHLQMPNWHQALIAFTKSGGYQAIPLQQLAQIEQPTIILWGDTDNILGTDDAEKFQQVIPQSQLFWIRNCGHIPHLEQPHITAEYILKFVSN